MNPQQTIFLCHASADAGLAKAICQFLESRGLPCWISLRDIPLGANYGAGIIEGINGSHSLLVILSRASNASVPVANEVERAVHQQLRILPFRLEQFDLSKPLQFFLSSYQALDATTGRPEDHFQSLYDQCVAGSTGTQPAQRPIKVPDSPKRRRTLPALILTAGLAGAIALYFSVGWRPAKQPQALHSDTTAHRPPDSHRIAQTPPGPDTHSNRNTQPPHPSITPPLLRQLEGAQFIDGASEAEKRSETVISFSGTQGNEIDFFWKEEIYDVGGKMTLKGNTLVVIRSEASGSLLLSGQGTKIDGRLKVKSTGPEYEIHLTRSPGSP